MTVIKAADLPEGSVVASQWHAWTKTDENGRWIRTGTADRFWDSDVQGQLDKGAETLREGY